jgi:hypothetical protein
MKCFFEPCRTDVSMTDSRRVEVCRVDEGLEAYADGTLLGVHGMLAQSDGALVRVFHRKCWLAWFKRQLLVAARAADSAGQPGPVKDWHDQETCSVEEISVGFG